ncbi:MAG: AMP-binding protein [Bacteroidaceae bacterium]|nr:AMP-binding protein [Bacteroidaceae bacterium]
MKSYDEADKCLTRLVTEAIKDGWSRPALTDYQGDSMTYGNIAEKIETIHIVFARLGIERGDAVALCGRNCANWAVAFMATVTYGAVAVPILHEFKTEQIGNILEHSESKLLFAADNILKELEQEAGRPAMPPHLLAVVNLADFNWSPLLSSPKGEELHPDGTIPPWGDKRGAWGDLWQAACAEFRLRHPQGLTPADVNYAAAAPDDLAIINYTSGSTGKSKGVMLSQKNLWNNVQFGIDILNDKIAKDGTIVSILPMAHMYGLAFEILSEFCMGMHIYFLTKLSPTLIFKAFAEVKPTLIVCVPLIIEKVIRRTVMPRLQDIRIRTLLHLPVIGRTVKQSICKKLTQAFGGRFYEVIIGGAALSDDVSAILHDIGFRYTVGYGTTECAPLITYEDFAHYQPGTCGKAIDRMEIKIGSTDPANIVGEILVRGDGVMLGYFKNKEATDSAIDADGWYHTGDLGVMQADGTISIRGRSKNMLLGPNGQNIYPEEIEDKLNAMMLVAESVVIQKAGRLYALIYPDHDEAEAAGISAKELSLALDKTRREVNQELPAYEQIAGIKVMQQEFEKTPKKSIKRFLYLEEEVG